jgi:hypothetical protein
MLMAVAPPAMCVAFWLANVHPLLGVLPLVWCAGFMVWARRFHPGMPVAELLVGLAIAFALLVLLGS